MIGRLTDQALFERRHPAGSDVRSAVLRHEAAVAEDADPLADIKNIRKIRMVMKDGVIIDRDKLPINPIIYKRAAM